jgi:rubredoxin
MNKKEFLNEKMWREIHFTWLCREAKIDHISFQPTVYPVEDEEVD